MEEYKGKILDFKIPASEIQQVSKEMDKKDPVVKVVDAKNQVYVFKPLAFGDPNLDPLVDALVREINGIKDAK